MTCFDFVLDLPWWKLFAITHTLIYTAIQYIQLQRDITEYINGGNKGFKPFAIVSYIPFLLFSAYSY